MVQILDVLKDSYAEKAGILPSDCILTINGNEINDVLDYRFFLTDKKITLTLKRGSAEYEVVIKKSEYDDIGLEFDTYLMDDKKSCRNKCVFCFIDQLPKGMRDTLYFKDDDARLSFLMGNYITLTGLNDHDVERIVKMHMSPINISVHTTNPELRCKMMNNRFAGKSLEYLKAFNDGGIQMNCQIVLCRGLNDGDELVKTMHDLASFYPNVNSVSIVPVGLTDHRENLFKLSPFTKKDALKVVGTVETFADLCMKCYGSRIFFCSDEFYLMAGLELHDDSYYEGYPQIENGVGMLTSMKYEFDYAIENYKEEIKSQKRNISVATGKSAYKFIDGLLSELKALCPELNYRLYMIENEFFGSNITVAGLITATDLIKQLKGKELGDTLFLPNVMLESEGKRFLDDITLEQLKKELNVNIETVKNDGEEFILSIMGIR